MSESLRELIARSSLGGASWCSGCGHPRDNHHPKVGGCSYPVMVVDDDPVWCSCSGFVPMTPEEWLGREEML